MNPLERRRRNRDLVKAVRAGAQARVELGIADLGITNSEEAGRQMLRSNEVSTECKTEVEKTLEVCAALRRKLRYGDKIRRRLFMEGLQNIEQQAVIVQGEIRRKKSEVLYPDYITDTIRDIRREYTRLILAGERARRDIYDENARKLIESKVIGWIVKRIGGLSGDVLDDLRGTANEQFLRCVDATYDVNRPEEFSTHVVNCMLGKCLSQLESINDRIGIPNGRRQLRRRLLRGELQVEALDVKDLDERAKESALRRDLLAVSAVRSLNDLVGEEEDSSMEDFVGDKGEEMARCQSQIALREAITLALNKMVKASRNPSEYKAMMVRKRLVELRLVDLLSGIDASSPVILGALAIQLHQEGVTKGAHPISRERVRQIWEEARALLQKILVQDNAELMQEYGVTQYPAIAG